MKTSQDVTGRTGSAFHKLHLAETLKASDTLHEFIRS